MGRLTLIAAWFVIHRCNSCAAFATLLSCLALASPSLIATHQHGDMFQEVFKKLHEDDPSNRRVADILRQMEDLRKSHAAES